MSLTIRSLIISMTLMTGNNRTVQVGLLNLMQTQKAATNYGRLYAGMVIGKASGAWVTCRFWRRISSLW